MKRLIFTAIVVLAMCGNAFAVDRIYSGKITLDFRGLTMQQVEAAISKLNIPGVSLYSLNMFESVIGTEPFTETAEHEWLTYCTGALNLTIPYYPGAATLEPPRFGDCTNNLGGPSTTEL